MGMVTGSGNIAIHQLFSYDSSGNVVSVDYSSNGGSTFTTYYYLRNAQNDIVKIIDGNGATVVEYKYDSWGKLLSTTGSLASTLGVNQPFRYRGYVYDTETGWYYLQSRYYDPSICRFVSADVYLSTGQGVLGHNAFAYCANNPIIKKDSTGYAVETVFDIITLSISIVEVASNPTDIWAWIGLLGDAVDLIPFVTGVGELVRTIRIVDAVDDVVDAARVVDKAGEIADTSVANKIIQDISNDVSILPRTGSALKTDPHNIFPNVIDNYATSGTVADLGNATLYQVAGSYRGIDGRFEWIVQNGYVTHRMFVKGGILNGIPIRPE